MIRTVFVCVWIVLVTVFFSILAILASFTEKTGSRVHRVGNLWARSILAASRIRVKVKGLSNVDPSRSYIFMSNHQSNFDIPVLLAHLPMQFRWLAKAELFKIPIFGLAMKRAGYISIDRLNRRSAMKSLGSAAETIRNGVSVLIFPEGTRSRDGKIQPFRKGGFVLAVEAGVPVVPLIIHGTRDVMAKDRLRINPGDVVLEIAQPIETSGYSRRSKDALLENVREVICGAFEADEKERSRC
jgi:1-acyl-sn-glycerol-3-phosphate acyltransferase